MFFPVAPASPRPPNQDCRPDHTVFQKEASVHHDCRVRAGKEGRKKGYGTTGAVPIIPFKVQRDVQLESTLLWREGGVHIRLLTSSPGIAALPGPFWDAAANFAFVLVSKYFMSQEKPDPADSRLMDSILVPAHGQGSWRRLQTTVRYVN